MSSKIIFDCERMKYPNTGIFHYCLQLGNALVKQADRDILFYLPPEAGKPFGDNHAYYPQAWWHKLFFPAFPDYKLWHCTYQGSSYLPSAKKIKVILTIHDLNFLHEDKSKYKKEKYISNLKKKIEVASHVVVISKFVLNDLKQYIAVDEKKCTVIYNGCNIPTKNLTTTKPAFKIEGQYLFTIGTITDKKNFHVLPALLQGNNHTLIIAGIVQSKEYQQKILQEAKKYNVEERVIFSGAVTENEKFWLLQNCEAFVFPSIAEGFGLPVIEAMYFGKPIILSRYTSLPEIGGDDAYYFDSFEPEVMQKNLETALEDYNNHLETKIRAIKNRCALFSWDEAAKQYLKVYQQVLGSR